MALVLFGVGVVLYTLTAPLSLIIEGWAINGKATDAEDHRRHVGPRHRARMGPRSRAAAHQLFKSGQPVLVIDAERNRLSDCPYPHLLGDATRDEVLNRAGSTGPACSWHRWEPTPSRSS